MVLGFGKDTTHQNHEEEGPPDLEAEGRQGQTVPNNVDPGRNKVNPQVISQDDFVRNSLTYGMRVPTGKTSTWDRRLTGETEEFHAAVLAKYGSTVSDHKDSHRRETLKRAGTGYEQPLPTSVNNYLMGQQAETGEGEARYDLGRQRGKDTQEPAHHFNFHAPNLHDRVHGAINIAAGKVRMDQDISTRGKAEFHGETGDGH